MIGPTSSQILKTARERSCLSQTDVARRAGVAQSVISAYESGHREPGMTVLTKLIEATGHKLVLDLQPVPGAPRGLPDTPLGSRLRRKRRAIIETAGRHGARNIRIFGSVARGQDGPNSDIDFLVDLDKGVGLATLAGLERELSELLARRVDVVPAEGLKPRFRSNAERDLVQL